MKRSELISRLLALNIPGSVDPEVNFINPQMRVREPINTVEFVDGKYPHIALDYDRSLDVPEAEPLRYKTLAERNEELYDQDSSSKYFLMYQAMCHDIEVSLEPYHHEQLNPLTLRMMNNSLDLVFFKARSQRQDFIIADGLCVVGATTHMDKSNNSAVVVRFKPAFFPRQRWLQEFEDTVPLGFYQQFDLYLAYSQELLPTILARYGNFPSQYLSFNLSLLTEDMPRPAEYPFVAAYQRMELLNIDLAELTK